MQIEQPPKGKTKKELAFEEERGIWDAERNKYRTTWQKLFGDKKEESVNLAAEEALEMDAQIERLLKEGKVRSSEEAIESIGEEEQHLLHGIDIGGKNYIKLRTLYFARALEDNRFDKARIAAYWSTHERGLRKAIAPLIAEKAAELVHNKDAENLYRAFRTYGLSEHLNIEDLPMEDLKHPEIQGALKRALVDMLRGNVEYFVQERDKYARAGIVDAEEINRLPEIQELAKQHLIGSCSSLEYFVQERDKYARAGIVDAEEADNWPEIKDKFDKNKSLRK
jgi:hypothetical protein